ncbi:transporter substrate-binding domain-containing protein [Oxalobacteraceae bacterium]|nr:transporter substrate-binding domain-containing protein [Oxalobacteraceae bacterium]
MRARHVFLSAALVLFSTAVPACTLKMALEQWPPYVYSHPKTGPTGIDLELARAILKEAGCTLSVLPELPTARRALMFRQGELDLLLAASETKERRGFARFSLAYRQEMVGIFATSARLPKLRQINSFEAIGRQKLNLLVPKVGWYGPDYARAQPALEQEGRLSTFGNFQQGLRMLDAGRADLIMGDTLAVRYEARKQGVRIAALPFVPLRAPVHLMLNALSTTQADLDAINAAIVRLEQRGVLEELRAKHDQH